MINSKELVEGYINKSNWEVKENSNAPFSFGAMQKHFGEAIAKEYWLDHIYSKDIREAHTKGYFHIHDLGGLTLYCCGYSLRDVIRKGVIGVPNIPVSKPANHFSSIINQLANLTTVFQNEIKGAVAFNSVDTLLAPFIKKDKLSYEEVKQNMQNLIFSINSNSRSGSEPAFSNMTFDIYPPEDLKNQFPQIAGNIMPFRYSECQKEMDMLNRAFFEIMLEGDAKGKPFSYPIPTYNIDTDFDWDNTNLELLWEMAGKYGYPYFANFMNSDMKSSDIRSMCCRLNLDLRELQKRNGGLFGSGDSTGSIGVVTINLPRLAYEAKNEEEFFKTLQEYMVLAKESLEIKRNWLQKNILDTNAIPAYMEYVGTLNNHFNTIGLIGLNEMCLNLSKGDILTEEGKTFSLKVLDFMRDKLKEFQEETGNLYNLEATPAEGTAYRLPKIDKSIHPDIITQGTGKDIYYTNSCHIPVSKTPHNIQEIFDHQDELQTKFTGGTVVHLYLEGSISGKDAKKLVKTICQNYKLPYISLSPVNRYCPTHGFIEQAVDTCPTCGKTLEKYQRITGYIRKVENFNIGKAQEFKDRRQLKI
ncbi:ribonucleotide reductase of class III (anaerobic), large subunit [Oceanotoga phage vB_OteS-UFV02]